MERYKFDITTEANNFVITTEREYRAKLANEYVKLVSKPKGELTTKELLSIPGLWQQIEAERKIVDEDDEE